MDSKVFQSIAVLLIFCASKCFSQADFRDFREVYPIGEAADINWKSSYSKKETILFEANPIVRYSLYNNILKQLLKKREEAKHAGAYYISFRPQLRMFSENSKPVKMPSFRILLATQHLFRVNESDFFAISIESGHYSNGQNGCSFDERYKDGSVEGDNAYKLINSGTNLSEILNRKDGNFSTNLTEIIVNFRKNKFMNNDDISYSAISGKLGFVLYHNRFIGIFDFGGFTQNDIKLMGRYRLLAGVEKGIEVFKGQLLTLSEDIEFLFGAHPSVEPVRFTTTASIYPFPNHKDLGFFVNYIYGHDNYNFRFVDSGHQASIGLKWNPFPPVQVNRGGIE